MLNINSWYLFENSYWRYPPKLLNFDLLFIFLWRADFFVLIALLNLSRFLKILISHQLSIFKQICISNFEHDIIVMKTMSNWSNFLQTVWILFLDKEGERLIDRLSPEESFALLIAAAGHDAGHLGKSLSSKGIFYVHIIYNTVLSILFQLIISTIPIISTPFLP